MLVMSLFRQEKILTQICGNNFMVLKSAPPLIAEEKQIEQFVKSLTTVFDDMHRSGGFWTESLALARRAMNVWLVLTAADCRGRASHGRNG